MANLRIDQLPPVTLVSVNDLVPFEQGGIASHATIEQVSNSIHRYNIPLGDITFGPSGLGGDGPSRGSLVDIQLLPSTNTYLYNNCRVMSHHVLAGNDGQFLSSGHLLVAQASGGFTQENIVFKAPSSGYGFSFAFSLDSSTAILNISLQMDSGHPNYYDPVYILPQVTGFIDIVILPALI